MTQAGNSPEYLVLINTLCSTLGFKIEVETPSRCNWAHVFELASRNDIATDCKILDKGNDDFHANHTWRRQVLP